MKTGKQVAGAIDLEQTKIDHEDSKNRPLFDNLQGNILKGHDRDHGVLFFLKFNRDKQQEVRKQIAEFAHYVTSSRLQMEEWELYHNYKIPGGSFGTFYLTAEGYRALGFRIEDKGFDPCFLKGMKSSGKDLNDPDPQTWEPKYRQDDDNHIHAMILVADDDLSNLGQKVRLVLRDVLQVGSLAEIIAVEHASQLRDEGQQPIEHFGFRDGISNPMFLKSDEKKVTEYGGDSTWDPWAPLKLALVQDPFAEENCFGSYLVYRKLEQHVRLFETVIRNFASALELKDDTQEGLDKIKALVLGRFPNGTPATIRGERYSSGYFKENYNNFTYGEDPGTKCPMHAHIRKTNTREKDHREHRLVRRGMTYGKRDRAQESQGLSYLPNGDVGLLFMCYQSNIEAQFEFIQKSMANNPDFPKNGVGLDALIGQTNGNQPVPPQNWPLTWGTNSYAYSNAISRCVTLKGGEYFFAPSIEFLKAMP